MVRCVCAPCERRRRWLTFSRVLTLTSLKLLVGVTILAACRGDLVAAVFATAVGIHYLKEFVD